MTNNYDLDGKTRSSYEEQICEVLKGCVERGDYRAVKMILDQDEGKGDLSPETHNEYRKQFESKLGRTAV